ncbi:hypothetical protein HK097_006101 [Rhizophlyctis rosea]|uniref:SH3 domain-containing protein n=1 Tax=Rhizophlyctis rosea TaxID=64517 RepID=A0AAD5SDJ3_9FUNG|nr:hypothetical protein HK097_006101 [Rhizophlyctis rosea]
MKSNTPVAAIFAGVIVPVLLLGLLGLIVYRLRKSRKKQERKHAEMNTITTPAAYQQTPQLFMQRNGIAQGYYVQQPHTWNPGPIPHLAPNGVNNPVHQLPATTQLSQQAMLRLAQGHHHTPSMVLASTESNTPNRTETLASRPTLRPRQVIMDHPPSYDEVIGDVNLARAFPTLMPATSTQSTPPSKAPIPTARTTSTPDSTQQPTLQSIITLPIYQALWSHSPGNLDEMAMETGDKILVRTEYEDGWCLGLNLTKGGVVGMAPLILLERVEGVEGKDSE